MNQFDFFSPSHFMFRSQRCNVSCVKFLSFNRLISKMLLSFWRDLRCKLFNVALKSIFAFSKANVS